ncbi:MAG: RluA family pseudouridine synthase [Oscillospiraceae bacterium]|nr:RluA family pseudouridine synthase [Oscillospiraceae bacterium]
MKEFIIGRNDAGQRLDRFAKKAAPGLPDSLLQKYLRRKDIKINGRPGKGDARLEEGDSVRLYIPDEFFETKGGDRDDWRKVSMPKLAIAYEDENILVVDKKPGVLCHASEGWSASTLIAQIQAYLHAKGDWDPRRENSFAPALCNRIDRNTGGLVIAAKNAEALRIMDEKIRLREMEKRYLCVVLGKPKKSEGRLDGYLFKDAKKNQVYVYDSPRTGALSAATEYRVLKSSGELSLVECRLITGRTHQIRAQMAHFGHPLLGDGKYGVEKVNRRYGEKMQLLYSCSLRFTFETEAGALAYLDGRLVTAPQPPAFVEKYFGNIK